MSSSPVAEAFRQGGMDRRGQPSHPGDHRVGFVVIERVAERAVDQCALHRRFAAQAVSVQSSRPPIASS